ncbi:MAG TPA: arabinofuranosidase catalytic domain-containing protein, partial [Bryobacteraceae bacterium]|nr:arabinofuranosidase catalytic domain-containing protein [Bryobacteraceae bacterium]
MNILLQFRSLSKSLSSFEKILSPVAILFAVVIAPAGAAAQTISPRSCDLYASGTPCVAAFSTTRALYRAYTGPLYQVTRQSDKTHTDIGLLRDGYANAVTQDKFCANTSCTITKLYDQSPNHNDLTPAPPGGAA